MTIHERMIPRTEREKDLLKYGRSQERERIIKLLEEHIPIEDNYNMESSCRGCDWEWAWNGEVNDSHEAHIIALIKGEK